MPVLVSKLESFDTPPWQAELLSPLHQRSSNFVQLTLWSLQFCTIYQVNPTRKHQERPCFIENKTHATAKKRTKQDLDTTKHHQSCVTWKKKYIKQQFWIVQPIATFHLLFFSFSFSLFSIAWTTLYWLSCNKTFVWNWIIHVSNNRW